MKAEGSQSAQCDGAQFENQEREGSLVQLLGLREKLQEIPISHGKIYGFL